MKNGSRWGVAPFEGLRALRGRVMFPNDAVIMLTVVGAAAGNVKR